jgi:hypothetical protein
MEQEVMDNEESVGDEEDVSDLGGYGQRHMFPER